MEDKREFNPKKYVAKCCGDVLQSRYEGEWVACKCGKAFIDETAYYCRGGGEVELMEEKELFGEDKED